MKRKLSFYQPYLSTASIMKNNKNRLFFVLILILVWSSACSGNVPAAENQSSPVTLPIETGITPTPFLPQEQQSDQEEVQISPEERTTPAETEILVPDGAYQGLLSLIVDSNQDRSFSTWRGCSLEKSETETETGTVTWVLAAASGFNSIPDGITQADLMQFFEAKIPILGVFNQILTTPLVAEIISNYFDVDSSLFVILPEEELRNRLYQDPNSLVIIPFDQLIPAYKVLRIDQISPFDQDFDPVNYGLTLKFSLECTHSNTPSSDTWSNRDPEKFTSVLLTGTTALTRAIAYKMEINGYQYPGEKVKIWFDAADISHVSNEVSYYEGCSYADPNQEDLFFCGRPEYMELFTYLGIDVIELTGNHLVDKGVDPLVSMMESFDTMGIPYYAAGLDAYAAAQAAYFEVNGNRIAFIGCNAAGPNFVYATDARAGVNYCDMDAMALKVQQVVKEGYLPVVTFQYWETYQFDPMPWQRDDSQRMIESGAVIVSGSQAHLPMTMEVYRDGFIHYGLGNMFFDQMDIPVVGTRREFADRHIFYNGQYLGVELLTAMLEDYSQPRPMTDLERQSLLQDAFVDFTQE